MSRAHPQEANMRISTDVRLLHKPDMPPQTACAILPDETRTLTLSFQETPGRRTDLLDV